MRSSTQLFPEHKDTSVTNDMADIHSLAEDDLRDTELLIRMAIKNLKLVIEVEKLFEPVFSDVLRALRLAEEKACESAYWHGNEASQLTGGQCQLDELQESTAHLDSHQDASKINTNHLAAANAVISKTLLKGFKNDGRR